MGKKWSAKKLGLKSQDFKTYKNQVGHVWYIYQQNRKKSKIFLPCKTKTNGLDSVIHCGIVHNSNFSAISIHT